MAHGAFIQRAGVALQVDELQRVFRLVRLGDGMRAVMTGFAIYATVPGGLAIQRRVLVVFAIVMAGIAARLVQPGVGVLFDLLHGAVAAGAVQVVLAGHDIAQALGGRARVAVIATVSILGYFIGMLFMHGL